MLCDNVNALVQKLQSGLLLNGGVVPCIGEYDLDLSVGVYGLYAEGERVDTADNLRNALCSNVADVVLLGLHACNDACEVTSLVNLAEVGGKVVASLVAGAVSELNVRVLLSHLNGAFHEAEGVGVDEVAALVDKGADSFAGIGNGLCYVLNVSGLNAHLLDGESALVVSLGVAAVVDLADVDEACLNACCVVCCAVSVACCGASGRCVSGAACEQHCCRHDSGE